MAALEEEAAKEKEEAGEDGEGEKADEKPEAKRPVFDE
jgi:hypothetical protein